MQLSQAHAIADEQIGYWIWQGRRARWAWEALGFPPTAYVSWPMVRREMVGWLLWRERAVLQKAA